MTATAIAAAESPDVAGPRTTVRSTLAVSLLAALVPALAGLAFLGRYGWDRDELYFLEASHHLAFGYVDFPPLTALVGRAVVVVFGTSLDALRLTTMVIGLTSVAFVALSARELGGSLRAQAVAALAWATAPIALGAASIFHPTWLDLGAETATLYLVLVAVTRPMPRLWPAVGVMAGIGLEAKYTIVTMLLALVAGLALTPQRRVLKTRGPWIATGIAFVLLLPNIGWEIHNGWPSAAFAHSQRAQTAADTPPPAYVADAVVFLAACTALAVIGGVWMWRRPALRAFTWAALFVVVGFGLEQGRGYYPLPAMIVCVAAGAVALERWRPAARWRRRAVLGALVAVQLLVIAVAAQVVVPIRSTTGMIDSGIWNVSFFKDEIGWPEMVAQTARAWRSLPAAERAHAAILAQNYGEAGALARFGPSLGLPQPLSGHLSWQYWRPARLPQRTVLTVGYYPGTLREMCTSYRRLATIENAYKLDNEERGRIIAVCRLPQPLGAIWGSRIASDDL
jgi:4-amino-4-deoxy-L-arabinose transferase-like glycosyltransferase